MYFFVAAAVIFIEVGMGAVKGKGRDFRHYAKWAVDRKTPF